MSICEGQQAAGEQSSIPSPTPYAVEPSDGSSSIWSRTVYEQGPDGQIIPQIHSYTELATGLNHLVNGQWVPSREEIDILPDGTAAATNGQHQVYFPADIYNSEIMMVTPDGTILQSRPMGLSFDDGSNTVLIATLTNSTGELESSNVVVYPNAFVGINADLQYTYTKAGFEQDVILHNQPPAPESFNMNSQDTRLQILTEFFNPPQTSVTDEQLPAQAGMTLDDESLGFGGMTMGQGKAFLTGTNQDNGAMVAKQWINVSGQQILVEEVPLMALAGDLQQLPASTAITKAASPLYVVSAKRLLPNHAVATSKRKGAIIARASVPGKGVVLDYVTLNSSLTNYTFQANNTYYISGSVYLYGTNTFEGGTVIKYAHVGGSIDCAGGYFNPTSVEFLSTPYRPVIFTSANDNTVGEIISGSIGNQSFVESPMLQWGGYQPPSLVLQCFRMSFFTTGLEFSSIINPIYIKDAQFDRGSVGLTDTGQGGVPNPFIFENVLFENCTSIEFAGYDELIAENCTFDNASYYGGTEYYNYLYFTNCIFVNSSVANAGLSVYGNYNGFYNSSGVYYYVFGSHCLTNTFNPIQTVGGGRCYLTNGCIFLNSGTTNIDPALLSDLATKTVYPPNTNTYVQTTISTATTISTNVARDNSSTPSLGYHYDPIDYVVDELTVTNATLTVTNGAVLATYNEPGIQVENGGSIVSIGMPTAPNWFVRYQSVQDETNVFGGTNVFSGISILATNGTANGTFQFSKFSVPENGGYHFYDDGVSIFTNLLVQDCELYDGTNDFSGGLSGKATLQNNLFQRSSIYASNTSSSATLVISNNLFWGTSATISQPSGGTWYAFNNDFDSTTITNSTINNGYNAYLNCSGHLSSTNSTDIFSTSPLAYLSSFLGNFYQPPTSPLIQAGSTTADQAGLYEFTTQTNEVPETNATVDIGYHYVATDQYGNPLDTYTPGVPNYIVDAQGNGMDTNGLPYWWEGQYFGTNGLDPNSDPDGNGYSLIYDYTNDLAPDEITDVNPVMLASWSFDNTNTWIGDQGQLPLIATNIVGFLSWETNAVVIDSTNPAILSYRVIDTNGNANIDLRYGTVQFWFKPDWGFGAPDGVSGPGMSGPGTYGRLIEASNYNPAFTNGWWSLFLSPDGSQLTFGSSTNGAGTANLSGGIFWAYKQWHQVALTYSPTCTALYVDGQQIAYDNTDPNYYPTLSECSNSFRIGSDSCGQNQADGTFEDLQIYDYPLSATVISSNFAAISLPAPPTVSITSPAQGISLVTTNYTLPITVNAQAAPGLSIQQVIYGYDEEDSDPFIGISTQSPFSIGWTNSEWTNAFGPYQNGYRYILIATAIDDEGVASTQTDQPNILVELNSDGSGLPDWWQITYFGTNNLDPNSSPDGNGQSLMYDYTNGINPTDYYDGVLPNINIVGGIGQTGTNYLFLPQPLTVSITDAAGVPLTNAPVVFLVTNGAAELAATTNDVPVSSISVRTDTNGLASIWCYFPTDDTTNIDSIIDAQAWSLGNSEQNMFFANVVQLSVTNGNYQAGNYNSFLPSPLVVSAVGTGGFPFTNAPLIFSVTNGAALLAVSTNDSPASSVTVNTDVNGQATVWVYIPPASTNPPDSIILVSAASTPYPVTIVANEYGPLAHWTFNNTNTWIGEEGQLPLLATNVVGVPDWSSNAMLIDSTNTATLSYAIVNASGSTNINYQSGSVLFYFDPYWSSANQSGTGPGDSGRLIEMGSYNSALTNDWWSLYLSPDGNQLYFATATNDVMTTNLTANISFTSDTWYQIALAYTPTNTVLYVDGQVAATGTGITYLFDTNDFANEFRIGSDECGTNQADGAFDELETFASPLAGIGIPAETYWFGMPDYQSNPNGALGSWELEYFGYIGLDPNSDPDNDGNNLLYDYNNGINPNILSFSLSVGNQYVDTNIVDGTITVLGGIPSTMAVLVDSTNFASAVWMPFDTNITINLGSNPGPCDVWVGVGGPSTNVAPSWDETTVILETNALEISITNPADGSSFNASRVDVSGSFSAASVGQISVNGVLAFISGTNFDAINVPLNPGSNAVTAVIEDLGDATNAATINIMGLTNSDGSMNDPVDLLATPVAGFAPRAVTFSVQTNLPGTVESISYDFNGDDISDLVTNNLDSFIYIYPTNGEFFPVVTIQTTVGRFSSAGGWNFSALNSDSQSLFINVQPTLTQTVFTNITDPVALKWTGTNLYVLSGTTATITEFDANANVIRSTSNIGSNPSGFDVDSNGNIYVAVTASNQVWKLHPSGSSFVTDTSFGTNGVIGYVNGASGTSPGSFNAPYGVAVSSDNSQIAVSDSGNNRIQFFDTSGNYTNSYGSTGNSLGEFSSPEGLSYDSQNNLYIADTGNDRIVVGDGLEVLGLSGTNGADVDEFNSPADVNVGQSGIYVADTENNRIQSFNLLAKGIYTFTPSDMRFQICTNLNEPVAVAAADTLTNEAFYVADTGNNRILLYSFAADDPTPAWTNMLANIASGDVNDALTNFSVVSIDDYRQTFFSVGITNALSTINQIGTLVPVYIKNDMAEYYFSQTINGQTMSFPIEFDKENGMWKIISF